MIAHEVLKNDADLLSELDRIELTNIDAIEQDRAFGRDRRAGSESLIRVVFPAPLWPTSAIFSRRDESFRSMPRNTHSSLSG